METLSSSSRCRRSSCLVGDLLILGFTLSLDNFRTAIALGGLRLEWRHAGQVALAFGFWDAVAPLVGILVGHYLDQRIGATAEYVGAIALGAYGLYLLAQAWRTAAPEEFEQVRALFGLPLPLSLDNVFAGTSLGLLGFSPWLAAPIFGVITALMSFAGLQLGRAAAHFIRIRSDVLTGAALVVMATVLGLGLER
jgi:putative Mn2+ efflux pump MntP